MQCTEVRSMARAETSGRLQMEEREMEDYRDIYETHRIELVGNLRVHRTFLFDYLRSKKVLDTEDCELIQAEVTSERKAGKLLDLLRHKGKDGFACFTEALQLQSPELYKTLTGKDADSTPNPILMRCQNSCLRREGGMEDVEIELLTEHLSRSYAELQRMSSQYNNMVKEKRKLEGQLKDNQLNLERKSRQISAWEERFKQEKTFSLKKQNRAEKCMFTMNSEIKLSGEAIQSLEGEICSLKMKNFQANQEMEELKTALSNANTKKEQEIRYRQEIGENFQKERKQAARLSLKIKSQVDELQALDHYRRRCGELDLTNEEQKMGTEKLQKELNELAKWTKGLKDHFDLIEIENVQAQESNRNVAQNIKALQDKTKMFKQKSSYLEVENDFLKFRITFLEKDCEIYKQQRDSAMTSRNEATEERDKVWRERELAWHHYIEMQKARDSEIEKRESCMTQLDEKEAIFNETFSELCKTKLKLNEVKLTVEELECIINDLRKTEETNDENKNRVESEPATCSEEEEAGEVEPCRLHSKKDLIKSLKRRIQRHNGENRNLATWASNTSLARRSPSLDFLMSMIGDFSEDNEASFSPISRWASCPQLDDISQNENGTTSDFPVKTRSFTTPTPLEFYKPEKPNMDSRKRDGYKGKQLGTEGNTSTSRGGVRSTSSDSDNPESCTEDDRAFLSEGKAFRRRTNVMTYSNLPLMRDFRRRFQKQGPYHFDL